MADDMISKNVFMSVGVAIFLWTQFFVPTQCQAVPSFARQTGMPCTACHTSFPQLTPYGRFFKLNGYVMSNDQGKLPPIAMMVMPSFTHTQKSQAEDPADGFDKNNDLAITQASVFYAGRLFGPYAKDIFDTDTADMANKIGVFLQGTFDGVAEKSTWDNAEIRYANTAELFGGSAVYGLYANNNPSMQDLWNTTPVWGYPFSGSGLAPTPGAGTLLGGGVSQQVGGMGTYLRLENGLYLDVGAYRTLSTGFQKTMGVDYADETQITDLAPYWRIAEEKTWGPHTLEVGTFGMFANTYPGRDESAGQDKTVDIGFDSQYQYFSKTSDVTVLASWLHEQNNLDATEKLGSASNSTDHLSTTSLTASYLYDKTIGPNIQYFRIDGDKDALLYADNRTASPNSDGLLFQLDYLPFNRDGGPDFWPKSNLKLSLQYILYNRFDGATRNYDGNGRDARDNNTTYLEAWLAF